MNELSRLRWRCRRGMRELDLLLERFLDQGYADLDAEGRDAFERLLDCQDDRLYDWFYQDERPEDPRLAAIVNHVLRSFLG